LSSDYMVENFVDARRYWLNYRAAYTVDDANGIPGRWLPYGLQVDWARNQYGEDGAIQLDMTPFSNDQATNGSSNRLTDSRDKEDGVLVIGGTFSDHAAGIHITPVAGGGSGPDRWLDVVINIGDFADNRPPEMVVSASNLSPAVGEPVTFEMDASDPDGDALAYHWEFDDPSLVSNTRNDTLVVSGLNRPVATKTWAAPGQYVVLATVSDKRGGVTTRSMLIEVGSPESDRQIHGRVLRGGRPLAGARVFIGSQRQTWTDSEGAYVLAGLSSSGHNVSAAFEDYALSREFVNAVDVSGGNAYGREFFSGGTLDGLSQEMVVTVAPHYVELSEDGVAGFAATHWDSAGSPSSVGAVWEADAGWISIEGNYQAPSTPRTLQVFGAYAGTHGEAMVVVGHGVSQAIEDWRLEMFGVLADDPLVSGDLADPNMDGVTNLLKYAFGLDPLRVDYGGMPTVIEDGEYLRLTYRRRIGADDIRYLVVCSTDLEVWTEEGVIEEVVGYDEGVELVEARVLAQDSSGFLRVKVERHGAE